ncbi:hypothetical protein BD769DRAFT_1481335 [Suillus cothurnatus]|nr:hypothetical protein BD769DRAFT_1481335 [Suillus cothurnatus]
MLFFSFLLGAMISLKYRQGRHDVIELLKDFSQSMIVTMQSNDVARSSDFISGLPSSICSSKLECVMRAQRAQ